MGIEPNGFNINTNCGAMYPELLSKKVIETRADIGIALDGDARIGIVTWLDEEEAEIWFDWGIKAL